MNGQQANIDTISNNLSNVNTTGYKQHRVEFEDLLYQNVKLAGTPATEETTVTDPIELEEFTGLTLNDGDTNFVETVLTARSRYIRAEVYETGSVETKDLELSGAVGTGAYAYAGDSATDKLVFRSKYFDSTLNAGKVTISDPDNFGYFNVYITFPLSQEKGVNTMSHYVNNRFGTLQGWSSLIQGSQVGSTSTQLIMETDEVQDYVLEKTPVVQDNLWRTLVIAVPNSSDYEGNTVFENSGMAISICPPSEQAYPRDTRGTIQHEAGGHGFGKLGDEMISRNAFAPNSVKQLIEDMHGRGWFDNLAATGKLHDVPWAQFIFDPDYSNYVDVYEGGYGYTRDVYRPEANSCMNYGIPYYNTPSRLSIYKRIKNYAGDSWWMGEFRQVDTFEWGPTTVTRGAGPDVFSVKDVTDLVPITNGNHHTPTITRFSEMGRKVRAIREKLKK